MSLSNPFAQQTSLLTTLLGGGSEPSFSKAPSSSDIKIGTTTIGGTVYQVYTDPSGQTFTGPGIASVWQSGSAPGSGYDAGAFGGMSQADYATSLIPGSLRGNVAGTVKDVKTGQSYSINSPQAQVILQKYYKSQIQASSQNDLAVSLTSAGQPKRTEALYSSEELKKPVSKTFKPFIQQGGLGGVAGRPSFRTTPTSPVSSAKGFVETKKIISKLDMEKRGQDLIKQGQKLSAEKEKVEKQANILALTGAPSGSSYKLYKDYEKKVEDYEKTRGKYLSDVGIVERASILAKMYGGDLSYAPGVGVPPVPFAYEAPLISKEGFDDLTETGSLPSHFVEKKIEGKKIKGFFDEIKAKKEEVEYLKVEKKVRSMLPAAISNLIPETKPARDFFKSAKKGVDETIAGIGKVSPRDIIGEPIEDFPLFVEESRKSLRKSGKELIGLAASSKGGAFVMPELSKADRKKYEEAIVAGDWGAGSDFGLTVGKGFLEEGFKKGQIGVSGLDIGARSTGLGFVMLAEPVIGSLPDYELELGGGFSLTKGKFRTAAKFAGELAFFDALMVSPKAVGQTKSLISTGKISPGLRLDQPLRFAAKESGFFKDITSKYKLTGKFDIKTTDKDIFGKLTGDIETWPETGLKYRTARALGLTTEKTPISKKYTMKLLDDLDAKTISDNFALAYKRGSEVGRDEFTLITRKADKGIKQFASYFKETKTGVVGQAKTFKEAEQLFSPEAIKDIRKSFGTTRLATTSIDDVPVVDLVQAGRPLGGKLQVVGVKKDWVLEDAFRRYEFGTGKQKGLAVFTDVPKKTEKLERLYLKENIMLSGETLAPAPPKTPFFRKMAEQLKLVKPKTYPSTIPFETKGLFFEAGAKYFDDALLKPGDVLGKGSGLLKGKVGIGFEGKGQQNIIFKDILLDWTDIVPKKESGGIVGKIVKTKVGEKSLIDGLLKETKGKGVGFKPSTYKPSVGEKLKGFSDISQEVSGGMKTVTTTMATKAGSVGRFAQAVAGDIAQIQIPTQVTKKTFGSGGFVGVGLTKLDSKTIKGSEIQPKSTKQVFGKVSSFAEPKMVKNFVKSVSVTKPIQRLKQYEFQKIKPVPIQKIKTPSKMVYEIKLDNLLKTKLVSVTKTRPVTKIRGDIVQIQSNMLRVTPVSKISYKLKSLQKIRTDYKIKIPPVLIPKPPEIPTIRVPKTPFLPILKGKKGFRKMEKNFVGFGVEVKRRGKWRELLPSKTFTKETALKLGAGWATKTLGASFRLKKKAGKPLSVRGLLPVPKGVFRKPIKKGQEQLGSDIFIQRAKYRLSSKSEKAEIKKARLDKKWASKNLEF